MGGLEAKPLVDTYADPVAEAKAGTTCITQAHIMPEVLVNRLAKTLVQAAFEKLADTGGS